ncbi:MAG: polysaccharide biosynthesis protein, partial [Oscillospiraceae bacterium]|nr:polysaccharide biosynthesis protein [Oscillospiraceae bacterium]
MINKRKMETKVKSFISSAIAEVNLEDLLGRNEIRLDMDAVSSLVRGKTVMVTGGAGSIGSELCRQVLSFGASRLIVFDINENGLYEISYELKCLYPDADFTAALGSIRDIRRLREVFAEYSPEIVFHAAAHKHVPMSETNPF